MSSKILLVDDEPAMLKMLKWRLETQGYEVISALSGLEALDKIDHTAVDFVITDVRMPMMDGLTLVRRIKQQHRYTPCIVMSGHGDMEMSDLAEQAGACGYIHKPIRFEELNGLIQQNLPLSFKSH
jgi:DNA-binding NtrC family response regulator